MPVTTGREPLSHEQRIESQAESLVGLLAPGRGSAAALVNITGGYTTGKTSLLRELDRRLLAESKKPIMVSPPSRELDAGLIALLQLGTGLRRHNIIDGQLDELASQESTWSHKLELAKTWLSRCAGENDVVLLIDEPHTWPSRAGEDTHFGRSAEDMASLLFNQDGLVRVVTGRLPEYLAATRPHRADLSGDRARWLLDPARWGAMADAASQVASFGAALEARTPLEIRLMVAIQWCGRDERLRHLIARPSSRRQVSEELRRILGARQEFCEVRRMWARTALVRGELTAPLLECLGLNSLAGDQRDLVRYCLLYSEGDRWFMHETLRRDVQQCGWIAAATQTHRLLAEHYRRGFERADGDLVAEAEAYHHATQVGDREFAEGFRVFFAEQLDALGKMLSLEKQYQQAVAVYERAIQWDPDDDYAHHYLAYNLDFEGRDAPRVERHYQRAMEIEPANAYWHSRWITYLITRSRLSDARRAWDEAMDALGLPDDRRDGWVYENVHIWVARLLIHRGQLDFARDVLQSIPLAVRERNLGMKALARRLEALIEAQRVGAVFPLWVAPDNWWRGPHLAAPLSDAGRELETWRPGRVESVDELNVHLLTAQPPAQGDFEPIYGSLSLPREDFDRFSRDIRADQLEAGSFVEIAAYVDRDEPIIRVHQDRSFRDDDLPPLLLDPARYLRAAGWIG